MTTGRTGRGKWKNWIRSNTKLEGGVDEAGRRIKTPPRRDGFWHLETMREEKRGKVRGRKKRRKQCTVLLLLTARRRNRNIFCLASKEKKRKRYASFARRRATRAKWSVTVENDVFSFCSGCARGSLFDFQNLGNRFERIWVYLPVFTASKCV